jgi:hypothetical protein
MSAKKDNKYIELDTTRPSEINKAQYSIFEKVDGGPSFLVGDSILAPDSTFRDTSKHTADKTDNKSALKNALNSHF